MRIIAGRFKGARLSVPRGLGLRPTTDRVREAVFNALGTAVLGNRVLDLFAGSGAFGVEALSRGAASAVFVDPSRKATEAIRRTIQELGLAGQSEVLAVTALRALRICAESADSFGIVFLDPPYHTEWVQQILGDPALRQILRADSLVVTERDAHSGGLARPPTLMPFFFRKYGGTVVEMFQPVSDES